MNDWTRLQPGTALTVVKIAPEGAEAARYPGEVVMAVAAESWVVVRARWTHRLVELDGLQFRPDDLLLEWFSPEVWFNAFAVHAPDGAFRGWYANVTYPPALDGRQVPPLLAWHDLYIDLVGLPDGAFTVRDDDELDDSGLRERDPALHAAIVTATAEVVRRFEGRVPPFVVLDPALLPEPPRQSSF